MTNTSLFSFYSLMGNGAIRVVLFLTPNLSRKLFVL
jgi:hypothetical protein